MTQATRILPRQRGNTLTGFIIGLVVGLAIAVAVALVITKGSTPFTDKSGKLGKLGEPTAGQAADPNKPMYGSKEAARQANKEIIEKQKPSDDPLGDAVAAISAGKPAVPAAKPATPATPAPAAPAATPAAAPAAAAPAPAVDDKVTYYLQAGAFREMDDAESTRGKLALLGFEAAVSEKASDSGTLYRVRIGPFAQAESMNKARAKLLDSGIDVAIVKNQK
jgi:cell division protein FtsN